MCKSLLLLILLLTLVKISFQGLKEKEFYIF